MTVQRFTLIDAQARRSIDVDIQGTRLCVSPSALEGTTGWQVKPEGFCRGDVCVPAGDAVGSDGRVDIVAFAKRLGRPIVLNLQESAISLGVAAAERADSLQSLEAPDFALPDLAGQQHALSQYRGKKILLATYASW